MCELSSEAKDICIYFRRRRCWRTVFIGVFLDFIFSYYIDTANPIRHEAIQGAVLAIMMSIPFWLSASLAMFPIRMTMPKWIWWGTNTITTLLCTFFLILIIYPLVMMVLEK